MKTFFIHLSILFVFHISFSKSVNVLQNEFKNYTNCEIINNENINCSILGASFHKKHKIFDKDLDAKKRIVHLNITLQVIPAETYNRDEKNDTRLMNVSIISTNIYSYHQHLYSSSNEDFMYPAVFSMFFSTLYNLTISLQYNDIQIDGNVILGSHCFTNNTLLMNTTECKNSFSARNVVLRDLYSMVEDTPNSAVNLFFYTRNVMINTLFYDGATKHYVVKLLKYVRHIENIYVVYDYDDEVSVEDVIRLVNSTYIKVLNIKPRIQFKILAHILIKSISDDFFKNNYNLEELSLVSNKFIEIPSGIKFLRKLKTLEITIMKNPNFKLTNNNLNQCLNLQFVKFSHAYMIRELNKHVIPQTPNLRHLHFEKCGIKIISPDTFASLNSLETINLSHNKLKTLDPNIFKHLANASTINLNYNFFKYGIKLNLNNVQNLLIQNCNISNPAVVIEGDVSYVDLSHNEITSWNSSDIFVSKNHRIRNLKLHNNYISTVNFVMGESMDKLESIRINSNLFDCSSCSLLDFRNWVLRNKTNLIFFGKKWLKCVRPENIKYKNKTIFDVKFNPLCLPSNPVIKIGLPVTSLIMFVIIVSLILYAFRFDMSYISHLWTVKNKNTSNQKQLEGCIFDAFVSYSVNDQNWVFQTLIQELECGHESEKYKLCLHERDGELGTEIMRNIVTCMEKSRHVILVLSTNFLQCGVCIWTLRQSQLQRVSDSKPDYLMIIELENLDRNLLPLNLRLLMGTRTYLEWPQKDSLHNSMTAFWTRLKHALGPPLVIDESQFDQDEDELEDDDIC